MKPIPFASAAAKYTPAPITAGAVAAEQSTSYFDPVTLAAIGVGLIAGAMWRAANLRESRNANWTTVQGDLLNSALAGLANAIAALFVTHWLGGGVLVALGVAMLIAATGVRALLWAQRSLDSYLRSKFGGTAAPPPGDA